MEIPLLNDIVVVFAISLAVILIFNKLKIQPIIGFLFTGILIGPHGILHSFAGIDILVDSHHEIEMLAEIGVILLLFTIGIEFSIQNLLKIKRTVLIGGSLQVGLTILLSSGILYFIGFDTGRAIFTGFMVSLSSTAIVLKIIQEKAEVSTHHGKTSLGILIFQDVIIVPMILLIPILAGKSSNIGTDLLLMLLKAAGLIIVMFVASRWIIPKLLHAIAKTKKQELFLLTILVIGFAVAWITSMLGLSLALGAFLAGLAISESEYSHHAFGNVVPFRDIFTSFFFISIGMLSDVLFFSSNIILVISVTVGILLLKTFVAGLAAFVLGLPFRTTVVVGLILSQIGEFSFILSKIGLENNLFDDFFYQLFLASTILTMASAPFIIILSPKISDLMLRLLPIPDWMIKGRRKVKSIDTNIYSGHLIIIGLGMNGKNLARAAKVAGIQYIIVDNDPDIVTEGQKAEEPVFYGDAGLSSVLHHAKIAEAEVLVITVGDPVATFRIIDEAKKINPAVYLIVRTKLVEDVNELFEAGADEVIPEEFETSIELFSRVMVKYLVPRNEIEKLVTQVRSDGYKMFRSLSLPQTALDKLQCQIPNLEIASISIHEKSGITGKTIADVRLRNNYGINILAAKRANETFPNPGSDFRFMAGDVVYILGEPNQIACANHLFIDSDEPICEG